MKTSLSPIALAALFVGPALAAWANQDAPTPSAPLEPLAAGAAASVPILSDIPTVGSLFVAQDDTRELTDEERALKKKLAALEQRAAELEAMLADRLAQQEDETKALAVDRERLATDLWDLEAARTESDAQRKALEAQIKDYLLKVDPATGQRELDVKDLLAAVPERLAEVQDEKVKAKIAEAVEKAQGRLDIQAAKQAEAANAFNRAIQQAQDERIVRLRLVDEFQQDENAQAKEEWRARAEEMRAKAGELRVQLEQGGYKEAHSRYKLLLEQQAELIDRTARYEAEIAAQAEMQARREDGEKRRIEREIAQTTREESRRRATERNAQDLRKLEQELADRESQRRTEEHRLRTELEEERRRLGKARDELAEARFNVQRDFTRAERPQRTRPLPPAAAPRPTRVRASETTPRAEPSRSSHSDVTIIVEQGDVHVHTGGGSPQVITAPSPRLPSSNIYFGEYAPLPEPTPPDESQGTTQAPWFYRYRRTNASADPFAQAQPEYQEAREFVDVYRNVQLELPPYVQLEYLDPAQLPVVDLALPDFEFAELPEIDLSLPEIDLSLPEYKLEAIDVLLNEPVPLRLLPLETPPECEGEPEPEPDFFLEGGVVLRDNELELRADQMTIDLAGSPFGSAPSQAELLDRILKLSEELKAEVGALRSELRDLREVVRDAPRR